MAVEDLRRELEKPLPPPDPAALERYCRQVAEYLVCHFATLPEQSIGRNPTRAEMEALLAEPAPEEGQDFARVLAEFQAKVAPNAFRTSHPRFLAFVPGPPTFLSALGDFLCAGTNFFSGVWLEGAGPAQVEIEVLEWFRDFLGLPPETRGILTAGGSEANLTALVVARETLPIAERARAVLYLTEQRHWSVDRAAQVIGLLPEQVRPVPAAEDLRLMPKALAETIRRDRAAGLRPWAVVANAGATNAGTIDPLDELAGLCEEERLWLHVDAAYGWSAVLTPEGKEDLRGIQRADSITLDPHKWFAQTFGAGCVLVRRGHLLPATFGNRPDYLQDVSPADDEINFADYGLALTRRFRALKIWLSVKVLGVAWYRELVRRGYRLADYAQGLLERAGCFQIVSPRRLSIVCFRYLPAAARLAKGVDNAAFDRLNLALVEALRQTGRAFLSSTRLYGCVALRFCFVNWRTTAGDVEEVVRLLETLGRQAEGRFVR